MFNNLSFFIDISQSKWLYKNSFKIHVIKNIILLKTMLDKIKIKITIPPMILFFFVISNLA